MGDDSIDIYDENNEPSGSRSSMLDAHNTGLWHHASQVFVYSPDGKVLLQKRSETMRLNPGRWEPSASGHVKAGMSPEEAAIQESKEEIGLLLTESELGEPIVRKSSESHPNGMLNNEFRYIFFVRRDIDESSLVVAPEEIQSIRVFSIGSLERMYSESPTDFSYLGEGYWPMVYEEIRRKCQT